MTQVHLDARWATAEEELREANLEIIRHHRDFQFIREILDQAERSAAPFDWKHCLAQIRNIVG
jgi:hypothetical protein